MIPDKQFFFLRHGATDWNDMNLIQGRTNVPLNEQGRRDALSAADLCSKYSIDRIVSSPLDRARVTATAIGARINCSVEIVPELSECCWGEREGEPRGQWFLDWRSGVDTPTGAESLDAFFERTLVGLDESLSNPGTVLIVAHTGTFWAIQHFTGLSREIEVPNGALMTLTPPSSPKNSWTLDYQSLR